MKVRKFLQTARKYNSLLDFRSNTKHKNGHIIECRSLFWDYKGWLFVANVDENGQVGHRIRAYWPDKKE